MTNRISQFFTVDSEKVEGKGPVVVRFLYPLRGNATIRFC